MSAFDLLILPWRLARVAVIEFAIFNQQSAAAGREGTLALCPGVIALLNVVSALMDGLPNTLVGCAKRL